MSRIVSVAELEPGDRVESWSDRPNFNIYRGTVKNKPEPHGERSFKVEYIDGHMIVSDTVYATVIR